MERRRLTTMNHPIEDTTPLDAEEAQGLKFKHITTRSELNHLETSQHPKWHRMDAPQQTHRPAVGKAMRASCTNVCSAKSGCGREHFAVRAKISALIHVHIAVELRTLLDDMQCWLDNETYPPREAVIRFHHRLTAIHPFPNGNGRHARIMADALLIKFYKLPTIDWTGGHDLTSMGNRRKTYIQALQAAD